MPQEPQYYRRNLPHWQPTDGVFHVIPRLDKSLPAGVLENLRQEYFKRNKFLETAGYDDWERKVLLEQERELYMGKFDEALEQNSTGPMWLSNPLIARIVLDSLLYFHNEGRYKLVCATVMPNHVHVILYKIQRPLFRIMGSLKTYTAKEANLILGQTGTHFWQRETFDHLVRNRVALRRQLRYVLENPVKAGLTEKFEDWPWTWLNPAFRDYL